MDKDKRGCLKFIEKVSTESPILKYPDLGRPYALFTDASRYALTRGIYRDLYTQSRW